MQHRLQPCKSKIKKKCFFFRFIWKKEKEHKNNKESKTENFTKEKNGLKNILKNNSKNITERNKMMWNLMKKKCKIRWKILLNQMEKKPNEIKTNHEVRYIKENSKTKSIILYYKKN